MATYFFFSFDRYLFMCHRVYFFDDRPSPPLSRLNAEAFRKIIKKFDKWGRRHIGDVLYSEVR